MRNVKLSNSEYEQYLKEIQPRRFKFHAMLMLLSTGGKCTKTQSEISEFLNVHIATVYRSIKALNKFYVKGQPLVTTVRSRKTNVYYILNVQHDEGLTVG
jgi:DNA-binding MarR family transcriptional regulator